MVRELSREPRNRRPRDDLGRPLPMGSTGHLPNESAALPPIEALAEADRLLRIGRPFAAHEVLEAVWKATSGPERELWRGLAQIAVAVTHALRGNPAGAAALAERAATCLLAVDADSSYRIDVDRLVRWCREVAVNPAAAAQPPGLTLTTS